MCTIETKTIGLLDLLDGYGLTITDYDRLKERMKEVDIEYLKGVFDRLDESEPVNTNPER